jgi:hypothetical protein
VLSPHFFLKREKFGIVGFSDPLSTLSHCASWLWIFLAVRAAIDSFLSFHCAVDLARHVVRVVGFLIAQGAGSLPILGLLTGAAHYGARPELALAVADRQDAVLGVLDGSPVGADGDGDAMRGPTAIDLSEFEVPIWVLECDPVNEGVDLVVHAFTFSRDGPRRQGMLCATLPCMDARDLRIERLEAMLVTCCEACHATGGKMAELTKEQAAVINAAKEAIHHFESVAADSPWGPRAGRLRDSVRALEAAENPQPRYRIDEGGERFSLPAWRVIDQHMQLENDPVRGAVIAYCGIKTQAEWLCALANAAWEKEQREWAPGDKYR